MPASNAPIPDPDDIVASNERLRVENARLTNELNADTELLEAAQTQWATAVSYRQPWQSGAAA